MSLRQESPFTLCGLQGCGKISLLTSVAVIVRGVPFHPFNTDGKRGEKMCRQSLLDNVVQTLMGVEADCSRHQFCASGGESAILFRLRFSLWAGPHSSFLSF